MLEHVPGPFAVIRDWHRVVKIGGFIVCIVPHQFLYAWSFWLRPVVIEFSLPRAAGGSKIILNEPETGECRLKPDRRLRSAILAAISLVAAVTAVGPPAAGAGDAAIADWPYYGGDAGGGRYSPLTQINKSNVAA